MLRVNRQSHCVTRCITGILVFWLTCLGARVQGVELDGRFVDDAVAATCLACTPDGSVVLSDKDGVISIWNWNADSLLHRLDVGETIERLAVSEDGTVVTFVTSERSVGIWRLRSNDSVTMRRLKSHPTSLAMSRNGDIVVLGTSSGKVTILGSEQLEEIDRVYATRRARVVVDLSDDGETVAYGDVGGNIRVVRVADLKNPVDAFSVGQRVACVDFSPDGSQLAVGTLFGGDVIVRDVGQRDFTLRRSYELTVRVVKFLENGDLLAVGGGRSRKLKVDRRTGFVDVFDVSAAQQPLLHAVWDSVTVKNVMQHPSGGLFVLGVDGVQRVWADDAALSVAP
mgnify:CR=1 FL=1